MLDKHIGTYWWTLPVHVTALQGRVTTSYKICPTRSQARLFSSTDPTRQFLGSR